MYNSDKIPIWWEEEEEVIQDAVVATVKAIKDTQRYRKNNLEHYLRLYTNRPFSSFKGRAMAEAANTNERIKFNVVKSCIDAAVAQIGSEETRVQYIPDKGSNAYVSRKRAEKQTKFVNAQFHELGVYEKSLSIFRDAGIFGDGYIKVYADPDYDNTIRAERVFPNEVLVDEDEAVRGEPRQMFQVRHDIPKTWLVAKYPKYEQDIMEAANLSEEDEDGNNEVNDFVTIIDAWHLPSHKDADDGKHFFGISNKAFVCEKWEREDFPIIPFAWSPNPAGFHGFGVAEELSPIQVEINYLAQKIQTMMTLYVQQIWMRKGENAGQMSNKELPIHTYHNTPPTVLNVGTISGEFFAHLDRLIQRAYELTGISQLSAQAKKPIGLDSGEALKVYNDIGSQRFVHTGKRWQQWFIKVGEAILDVARGMDEKDLTVLAADDKEAEIIKFKDAKLEKGRYRTQPWPTSLLPETPAGKIEALTKLSQAEPQLGQYMVRMLSGVPDLENVVSLITAPQELAEKYISNILEGKSVEAPFTEMDLQLTRNIAQMSLLKAINDELPEDVIDGIRTFIIQIDDLQETVQLQEQMQQQAAAGPGPTGPMGGAPPQGPTGPPGAPPDMLPQGGGGGMPPQM